MAAVPSIGRASLVESGPAAPEAIATHALYERHAAKIHNYCRHQLGSREEAEDAVQTTFMNAFRALGNGVVPEAETAWLFKIAENVCLSRRRSSWRRNRIESPADFELIEEIVPGPTRHRDELIGIEDALAAMPGQQRRAILLREWQGLSYREISAELELSQSAVETLIFRARRSLAQGLTEPHSLKPPAKSERKRLRRTLHLADLTSLLAAAKSLFAGSAALKATAAAVAVTAAAGTAVTVGPSLSEPPRKPALEVPAAPPVQRPTPATAFSHTPAVATPAADERTPLAPRTTKAASVAKKPTGKAVERQRGRPALPLPAATRPDRAQGADRKADTTKPAAERKPKPDRAQEQAARSEERAQQQATARADRQARREQRVAAETRAADAKAKKAATLATEGAAAPAVTAAVAQVPKGERGQSTERALPAAEASGLDGAQAAGKQNKP